MVCEPACEGSVLGSSPMSVIVGWKKSVQNHSDSDNVP